MSAAPWLLDKIAERGSISRRELSQSLSRGRRAGLNEGLADLVSRGLVGVTESPGRSPRYSLAEGTEPELELPKKRAPDSRVYKAHPKRPTSYVEYRGPVMVFGDVHCPLHDPRAFGAMLELARALGIKHAVLIGDFLDFCSLGRWQQEAERVLNSGNWTVARECEAGRELLVQMLEVFEKIEYLPGNHEERVQAVIDQNMGLHGAMSLSSLLQPPPGVVVYPWRARLYIGKTLFEHGDKLPGSGAKHGAANVRARISANVDTVVYGHTHKLQHFRQTVWDGDTPRVLRALNVGWLGDSNGATYCSNEAWQAGGALITQLPSGYVHPELIEVVDGRIVFGGQVYG